MDRPDLDEIGMLPLHRAQVMFPVELRPPVDFRPDDPSTWPRIDGRLEYVGGRLLYMPPCGDLQQDVAVNVVGNLWLWQRDHAEFTVGGNEAGMMFGRDVRGAEAAVWRRDALGDYTGGYRRVPPILAVEVAGRDEGEDELRDKAAWYLSHGVTLVWIVLPASREVVVVRAGSTPHRCFRGERLPEVAELPGLAPSVDDFFRQLA